MAEKVLTAVIEEGCQPRGADRGTLESVNLPYRRKASTLWTKPFVLLKYQKLLSGACGGEKPKGRTWCAPLAWARSRHDRPG